MNQLVKSIRGWVSSSAFGPLLALLVVYALFGSLSPDTFLGWVNLSTMVRQTVVVAIVAVGMTLTMIAGGIDLSVGSLVALTTVVAARCIQSGQGALSAALIAVLAALLAGLSSGLLIVALRIPPFIATLGTMSALRGVAKGLAQEQKIDARATGLNELMLPRSDQALLSLPWGVWLALAVAALATVLLGYTRFGRHVIAVGSNAATARLCGISVNRVTVLVYLVGGLLSGLAGVLEFSTLTVGDPTDSVGLELEVIAAVVIGGGSLSGGQGSIWGTLLGALLLTLIGTGCTHVGVPNWIQEILTGLIIVVAMGLERRRRIKYQLG